MRSEDLIAILKGLATYIPGLHRAFGRHHMGYEPVPAMQCYRIWMQHLTLLDEVSSCGIPNVVAELGPGDTLGTGITTRLAGASQYSGVDVLPFAKNDQTKRLLPELVDLFRRQETLLPHHWPNYSHLLDQNGFPSLIPCETLGVTTSEKFVAKLARDVETVLAGGDTPDFHYVISPSSKAALPNGSVDMIFSHSVLEHVTDLDSVLRDLRDWLKPGGVMSHQYDLTSHNVVSEWDGHRRFTNRQWEMVVGKRPFMINRLPHSEIVRIIENAGFRILRNTVAKRDPTVYRSNLNIDWKDVADEDIETFGALVQAKKL